MALEPGVIDAQWTCKLSKREGNGKEQKIGAELTPENPVTVGEKFQMTCEGGSVDLQRDHLSLELPQEAKYVLRILKTIDVKPTSAEFLATTWSGEAVEFKHLYLTDGAKRVDLGPLKIEVKSVIPAEKAQEAKPYDPYAPVLLNLPLTVYLVIAVVLGVIGTWAAWLVGKYLRKKRLKSLIEKNAITMSAFNFFNKELRRLTRQGATDSKQYVTELHDAFRWYLTREFFISAINAKPKQILRDIQKKDPTTFKLVKRDLMLALTELEKALAEKQDLSDADIQQLTDLCRSLADRIHSSIESSREA